MARLCVWELTSACDQASQHSGPRSHRARDNELSTEESFELIAEMAELGVGEVTLMGGEAFLRDDLPDIIAEIRGHGMRASMTTGGYGISDQMVADIAAAGMQKVSVSVDGMQAGHDRLRGREGSWSRAMSTLRAFREAGCHISANTQINRVTQGDLLELFEPLAEAGIHTWQVQLTVAHGRAGDKPELLLQPYMLDAVFKDLAQLVERCEARSITLTPANSIGYFGPYDHLLRPRQRKNAHYAGCNAGVTTLAIESDGAIKNCPSLGGRSNVAGSWREHGLAKLWNEAPEMLYMRRRGAAELWGCCATCQYAEVCRGGCTSVSEPLLGRPGNNPMCHHRVLELQSKGLRERLEYVGPTAGEPFDNGEFRLIREYADAHMREQHGPLEVVSARTARADDAWGIGQPLHPAP